MTRPRDDAHHVTVIGAGIVGMACAIHLQRDGHRVTVIDRLAPGDGCSRGNAGLLAVGSFLPMSHPGILWKVPGWIFDPLGPLAIRWSYAPRLLPWLIRFVRAGRPDQVAAGIDALAALVIGATERHRNLAAAVGAESLIQPIGYMQIYEDDAAIAEDARLWKARAAHGVRTQLLKDGEVREAEPALSPSITRAIILSDSGYTTNPARLVRALAAHFVRSGGTLLCRTIFDVEIGGDRPCRLKTNAGDWDFDSLVIAAGAWSGRLCARLGHPVPLEHERGYHVSFEKPGVTLRRPLLSASRKVVLTPMEDGLRIAGTAEFAPADSPPNRARFRALLRHAKDILPGIDTGPPDGGAYSEWMGPRPALPDSLPVIGRSPRFPNVLFAFGHHHVGLTSAPITGQIIADLVGDRTPNVDLRPYRIDRF